MSSEYVHGHEYDTYDYSVKKDAKARHFTVTRPEEADVVSKGAYYHAHPTEVGPSFAHHDEHHYYETEVDHQQWDRPVEHHERGHYVPEHRYYDDEFEESDGHEGDERKYEYSL